MGWTPYQILLGFMMLVTGSINTLSTKWADSSKAQDMHGRVRKFDHPFLQSVGMFIGEMCCLVVYWVARKAGDTRVGTPTTQHFNTLIFWPAALCDMIATSLMYVGLNLTFASSFQMLRGAVIIFTALLSVAFLNRIVRCHMWIGMVTILVGLVMVGLSDILLNDSPASENDTNAILAGDLLIIMAQVITATQMVYEEKVVRQYNVPPLMAVGLEGLFGSVTLSLLLIPMYYILVGVPFTTDPDGRLENVKDAFVQMSNNWQIIAATVGNIVSIAFFNFSGISVTQEISATTRMVLDSCRTVVIWVVSLSVRWQPFAWQSFILQASGFLLLLLGMCLYNDIMIRPCLQRYGCLQRHLDEEPDPDEFEPLLGSADVDVRRQREVTYGRHETSERTAAIN